MSNQYWQACVPDDLFITYLCLWGKSSVNVNTYDLSWIFYFSILFIVYLCTKYETLAVIVLVQIQSQLIQKNENMVNKTKLLRRYVFNFM